MPTQKQNAETRLNAAADVYQEALQEITLCSLYLLATAVREAYPEAKTVSAGWSDQGDFLSGMVTVDAGLPSEDDDWYDDDLRTSNLDEDTMSTWQPFCIVASQERATGQTYTFDLDTLLNETLKED